MSRDLIERLRIAGDTGTGMRSNGCVFGICHEAADRIAALEAEALETARLLGMGGEREANLHGEVTRLKKALARAEAEASEDERRGLGEPVAWRWREKGSRTWQLADVAPDRSDYRHNEIVPLYPALIPEAPAREGWQPIETAPKDGSEIILFFPSYKEERVAAYRWRDVGGLHPEWEGIDGWSFDEGPDAEDAPTHWRALPPPPSQDREG